MATADSEAAALSKIELFIGNLLRYGVLLCALVIGFGIVLSFFAPGTDDPLATTIAHIANGGLVPETSGPFACEGLSPLLCLANPHAMIALGLALLIALPMVRVALTAVAFAFQREWIYTAVSLFVLAILLVGIFFGKEL